MGRTGWHIEISSTANVQSESSRSCGILYQKHLAQITGLSGLRTLKLRKTPPRGRCFFDPLREGEVPPEIFDLSPTVRLESLRCLHVADPKLGEGCGLGRAIKELGQLEALRVSVEDNYADDIGEGPGVSPISALLGSVYEVPSSAIEDNKADFGFPTSLKCLTLVDCYHK